MEPTVSDVHVDAVLANFAVEYKNPSYIGQEVTPLAPVNKKSDLYPTYTKENRFSIPETIRGPEDEANEIDWAVSTTSYTCISHALKKFVSDEQQANADTFVDPRAKTTSILTDTILLGFEYAIATLVTTAANYGTGFKITLSGNDQFDKYESSDPIGVVDDGCEACFVEPNTMIMSKYGWNILKRHPAILEHIKGGAKADMPSLATLSLLAEIFEVERVLVGKAKYNTAKKGQTGSYSYVWGKHIVLAYIDRSPGLDGVSAFKTFTWNRVGGASLYNVRTWRNEAKGGGGEYIEVELCYDEVMVCSDVCYLIRNAFA